MKNRISFWRRNIHRYRGYARRYPKKRHYYMRYVYQWQYWIRWVTRTWSSKSFQVSYRRYRTRHTRRGRKSVLRVRRRRVVRKGGYKINRRGYYSRFYRQRLLRGGSKWMNNKITYWRRRIQRYRQFANKYPKKRNHYMRWVHQWQYWIRWVRRTWSSKSFQVSYRRYRTRHTRRRVVHRRRRVVRKGGYKINRRSYYIRFYRQRLLRGGSKWMNSKITYWTRRIHRYRQFARKYPKKRNYYMRWVHQWQYWIRWVRRTWSSKSFQVSYRRYRTRHTRRRVVHRRRSILRIRGRRGNYNRNVNRNVNVSRFTRVRYVTKYRNELLRWRRLLNKPGISKRQKNIYRRHIYRIRVIRGGARFVNNVEKKYKWARTQYYKNKKNVTLKNQYSYWRIRVTWCRRYYKSTTVRRQIRICRRPRRRYGYRCGNFRAVFKKQFAALHKARIALLKARGAAKLGARINYAKARVEIYGHGYLRTLKSRVNRLTAAKKKKTFPALEKRLANVTAIYSATKAHFASGQLTKIQRDLTRIAKKQGCRRTVRRVRYFRGRRVSKNKVVRRVVRRTYVNRYKKIIRTCQRRIRSTTNVAVKQRLRKRIIRVRVIRSGHRYISRCNLRLRRYQRIYRKTKKPVVRRRIIVLKRRISICKRYYRSKRVQRIRRKVTHRTVVRRRQIRITRRVVIRRVRRVH